MVNEQRPEGAEFMYTDNSREVKITLTWSEGDKNIDCKFYGPPELKTYIQVAIDTISLGLMHWQELHAQQRVVVFDVGQGEVIDDSEQN